MEGTSMQRYLDCYNNLNNPSLSKTANKQLLQLESSLDAWTIAYQLITHPDLSLQLHGAQLLSKKLNSPPHPDLNLEGYLQYILEKPAKTQVLWLCLAKIMLHLSSTQAQLPRNLPGDQTLKLLREIPAALAHVHTQTPVDSTWLRKEYLKLAVPLLMAEMVQHSDLVLHVIDSFVSYGTKIQDKHLIKFLLGQPFQESAHILEDILSRSSLPELQNELIAYLESHRSDETALPLHLAFFRNAKVNSLSFEQLRSSLAYILICLSQEDSESSVRISQSYQFWHCISTQLKEGQVQTDKHQLFKESFLTLWKLTCTKSIFKEMPKRSVSVECALAIDVDNDDDDEEDNHQCSPEANKDAQYFRTYAGDFFMLCLETLSLFPQTHQQLFNSLQNLSNSQVLHLELAVFIAYNLTPCKVELIVGISQTVRNIFSRAAEMNEYLCSKVIDLIGELSPLLSIVSDLLMPMLIFLSNSIMYPALAPVAAVSCCNLLQQVDQTKSTLAESMEQFLTHAYEVLFRQDTQNKVIEHLTKAMTIFIYKFKHNPQDYQAYLEIFHQRCAQLDRPTRCRLIEAAISGQIWINCQEELKQRGEARSVDNQYLRPFGEYLEKQIQTFLEGIEQAEKKKQFSEAVVLINLAIKTNAVQGNGEIWCHLCDHILSKYLNTTPPLQITITPLINLTKCSIDLQNPALCSSLSLLLKKWHAHLTQLLDHTFKHCEFSLASTVLNLHLKIVQFLKKYPQYQHTIDYQPDIMVTYVTGVISRQDIWEYEVFKYGLNYLLVVVQLGYPPKEILTCLLGSFGRLQEALWTALDPILVEIYKCNGFGLFKQALKELSSPLGDDSNPLAAVLQKSFRSGDGKTIKNIFLSL